MADTSPNLMTSAGGAYDRGCFRRGGTCACGGGVCGKEARATPPSPSTAPEVDERAAFEAWARDSQQGYQSLKGTQPPGRTWYYFDNDADDAWAVWRASRAALASRPAEVDDAGAGPGGQMAVEQAETRMDAGFQPVVAVAQEVDDEGLPPLPPEAARATKGAGAFYVKWQEAGKELRGALMLYTAEQYRQGQRDAVAADRARRERRQYLDSGME